MYEASNRMSWGPTVKASALRFSRSIELCQVEVFLDFIHLQDVFQSIDQDGECVETLLFEIEPQVPQRPANDICNRESIAVVVRHDLDIPEVMALREDFPMVPHLNLRRFDIPKSVCMYEDLEERRLTFAPGEFLEHVRDWFSRTSTGELHQADQPLEPFLMPGYRRLIVPENLMGDVSDIIHCDVFIRRVEEISGTIACTPVEDIPDKERKSRYAKEKILRIVSVKTKPQPHGIIRKEPNNFRSLRELIDPEGVNLLQIIRQALEDIVDMPSSERPTFLALLLRMPRQRVESGITENTERWAFVFNDDISRLTCEFGLCQMLDSQLGRLIAVDSAKTGDDLGIALANTCYPFSVQLARQMSGLDAFPDLNIAMIGCGALGSQIVTNLLRMGIGRWSLIDNDIILPHNFARHAATPGTEGWTKADFMALFAEALIGQDRARAISGRVNIATNSDDVRDAIMSADVIIDATTSVVASRELAAMADAKGRRVSTFLNSNGTAAVLLIEDKSRSISLDSLEMQYYRFVSNEPGQSEHFQKPSSMIRYANSCRDVSFVLPQSRVATFAGILSGYLCNSLQSQAGELKIWQLDPRDWSIDLLSSKVYPKRLVEMDGWNIALDAGIARKIIDLRSMRLPNETGGVLLGNYDAIHKIIYIVDVIPSPSDSVELTSSYIRGKTLLRSSIEKAKVASGNHLDYIGEWHSHPKGCSPDPSDLDIKLLGWIGENMESRGRPGVELIVAEDGRFCVLTICGSMGTKFSKLSKGIFDVIDHSDSC